MLGTGKYKTTHDAITSIENSNVKLLQLQFEVYQLI
jgi:hypothetical protein